MRFFRKTVPAITLAAAFSVAPSAQLPKYYPRISPTPLALVVPNIPLSFSFNETIKTQGNEITMTGKVYRDAAGRVRTESTIRGADSHSTEMVTIHDPVKGARIVIFPADKEAYQLAASKSYATRPAIAVTSFGTNPKSGVSGKSPWTIQKESAGVRKIDGVDFEGTHFIFTLNEDPAITSSSAPDSVDMWFSDKLKLVGARDTTANGQVAHTELHDLHMGEPDAALFTVPSDYKLIVPKTS